MGDEVVVRARVPEETHRRATALLALEGRSMQSLLAETVEEYVRARAHLLRLEGEETP